MKVTPDDFVKHLVFGPIQQAPHAPMYHQVGRVTYKVKTKDGDDDFRQESVTITMPHSDPKSHHNEYRYKYFLMKRTEAFDTMKAHAERVIKNAKLKDVEFLT